MDTMKYEFHDVIFIATSIPTSTSAAVGFSTSSLATMTTSAVSPTTIAPSTGKQDLCAITANKIAANSCNIMHSFTCNNYAYESMILFSFYI